MLEGPYFDELAVGQKFGGAPGITLTSGLAAAHQAITGDRLALVTDHELCREVTGGAALASPGLVWDVAIGQSTVVTQHVKANLFYRGLAFRRAPRLGDTLRTSTEVVALRQNRPREGRAPTGLAVLRITTAGPGAAAGAGLLALRHAAAARLWPADRARRRPGLGGPGGRARRPAALVSDWRLDMFARQAAGPRLAELQAGQSWAVPGGDVVSAAPELARLTLNVAMAHHDAQAAGGQRLVYGGHTIGLALAQAIRSLPSMVTVAAWHGCDHLAPVHEGDTLRSTISVEQVDPLPHGGGLVHLRSLVTAEAPGPDAGLGWPSWRPVARRPRLARRAEGAAGPKNPGRGTSWTGAMSPSWPEGRAGYLVRGHLPRERRRRGSGPPADAVARLDSIGTVTADNGRRAVFMYPGTYAAQAPDRIAAVMTGTGRDRSAMASSSGARSSWPTCCTTRACGPATWWRC